MKDLTKCVLITATLFVLYSCMDKNGLNGAPEPTPEPEKPSVEDYFDFNTMQTIKVNIDYGFNDYLVLFELFDENPTEEPEDGSIIKKENIKGLFKASTDKSGRFSGNVTIPARTEKIWLYSDYLGTVSPIELTIKDKSISFNQNDYIASHRDRTRAPFSVEIPRKKVNMIDSYTSRKEYSLQMSEFISKSSWSRTSRLIMAKFTSSRKMPLSITSFSLSSC